MGLTNMKCTHNKTASHLARDAGGRSGKTVIEREEYKGKWEKEWIWKDLVEERIEERLGLQNRWTIYIFYFLFQLIFFYFLVTDAGISLILKWTKIYLPNTYHCFLFYNSDSINFWSSYCFFLFFSIYILHVLIWTYLFVWFLCSILNGQPKQMGLKELLQVSTYWP